MMGITRLAAHASVGALAALLCAAQAGAIDAQIAVNQQSGVAPLAVFFDARGTTVSGLSAAEDFLDASYEWSFGDTACEAINDVWIHSGRSKCRDLGPVGGHVYETPGTYTATLLVQHGTMVDTASVLITVRDPEAVFSGTSTVCVSRTGDFSDPSGVCNGAQLVTSTGSFNDILNAHFGPGVRILFRRGETWAVTGDYTFAGAGDAIVGAFGSGPKPVITSGTSRIFKFGSNNSGLRVMDISVQGSDNINDGSFFYTTSSGQGKNALALRVDVRDLAKPFLLGVNGGPQPLTGYMNNGFSIVECTTRSRSADSGNNDFFGGSERMLFMGNDFGFPDGTEHILRFQYLKGAVVSHNKMGCNTVSKKHVIKMHNEFDGSPCTEEVVLADNRADSGGASNTWDLGPQNTVSTGECVRLVRVERNHIVMSGSSSFRQILVRGGENLIANNILDLTNHNPAVRPVGILLGKRDSAQIQASADNRVLNNTCYTRDGGLGAECVVFSGSGNSSVAMNNLIYAPNLPKGDAKPIVDNGNGNTTIDNVEVTSNPFVTSDPRVVGEFKLGSGASVVIDQGTKPPSDLPSDFSGKLNTRISGNGIDIGAFEDRGAASNQPEAPVLLP